MPVPSSINDLSTTAASNSPAGGETPTEGDNHIRTGYSFIAQLRDGGGITGKLTGIPLGSAALPSYSFTGDVDTGMWSPAANTLAWSTGGTERLRLTSDGRFYGTALHNNSGAVTGTTNQYIASGTYTPTLTSVANVSGTPTAAGFKWIRVGNVVHVTGEISLTPSSVSGTLTRLGVSLPIASNLASSASLNGAANSPTAAEFAAYIGDATNDRAELSFGADLLASTLVGGFTYEVF